MYRRPTARRIRTIMDRRTGTVVMRTAPAIGTGGRGGGRHKNDAMSAVF
jgi:hypothetical protein